MHKLLESLNEALMEKDRGLTQLRRQWEIEHEALMESLADYHAAIDRHKACIAELERVAKARDMASEDYASEVRKYGVLRDKYNEQARELAATKGELSILKRLHDELKDKYGIMADAYTYQVKENEAMRVVLDRLQNMK